MLHKLESVPRSVRRFAVFAVASFALHAATLVSFPPSGVAGAPYRGQALPEPLHATLSPPLAAAPAANDAPQARASVPQQEAKAGPRQGVPDGIDVPFPDKWYTAAEVDVRAEPVGAVDLSYPEELEGSGIPGRVHLLLFIDERGVVRRMHIADAEPARLFDKAAMRSWTDITFSPAKKNGVAVKSQKLLELDFRP
jgi:TonB family protein